MVLQVKKHAIKIKHWLWQYSKEEVLARRTLCNSPGDSTKEIGMLIAAAFMSGRFMKVSLEVAFGRLRVKERAFFPKTFQYRRSLAFLQKLCMQSSQVRKTVQKNYLSILPFVFYNRAACDEAESIRGLSVAILKLINTEEERGSNRSTTTFMTCVSERSPGHGSISSAEVG